MEVSMTVNEKYNVEQLDVERAEAFAGRMLGIVNDGVLALMVSVGHRVGLFDVMAGMAAPADAAAIAAAAGLQERYVREWLAAMATGGVVEYDPAAKTFRLPPEHAASTTRAAGPGNIASYTQFVGLLAGVQSSIVDCFRSGGGVPYSQFSDFQRLMAEESAMSFDVALLDAVLPLVPGLPEHLESGIDVADVGCGSGYAINLMAATYPASRFVGFDISAEGIANGRASAEANGLTNATFVEHDAATLGGPAAFDVVTTFDAIHDQAWPDRVLRGIHDMLRPGGTYVCADIRASSELGDNLDHPLGPFLYSVSCMHCMTVSLAAGGAGLGAMWGEQRALEMLHDAGFSDVRIATVPGDEFNNYYLATR
jgi:SAM-dependent methyltransferase